MRDLGCDIVQGYLISQPLDPSKLKAWTVEFKSSWTGMVAEGEPALRRDVEADALGER